MQLRKQRLRDWREILKICHRSFLHSVCKKVTLLRLEKARSGLNADVNAPILGLHPFAFALQANSSNEVLAWLLDNGVALNDIMPKMEFTPLTLAVAQQKTSAADFLFTRPGIDINVPNIHGRNALGLAVIFCRELAVPILERDGNVLQVDNKGKTPWGLAILSQVARAVNDVVSVENIPHDMKMIAKMIEKCPACISTMFNYVITMEAGDEPSKKCLREDEFSALGVAATMGNVELIELLHKNGASLDMPSKTFGLTPLMAALFTRQQKAAEALLGLGANVNTVDQEGWTPAMHAVAANLPEALTLLQGKDASALGAITTKVNGEAHTITLLQMAMAWKKEDVAIRLVNLGVSLEESNDVGLVPLFSAVGLGMPAVVDAILQKGANPNVLCPHNLNPLIHAAFMPEIADKERITIYQALVNAGATKDGIAVEFVNGLIEWETANLTSSTLVAA